MNLESAVDHVQTLMPTLTLALMRPLGVMLLVPVLSAQALGGTLQRNGVWIAISVPIMLGLSASPLPNVPDIDAWIVLLMRELCVGIILGFAAAIPFWAIDMAGYMVDAMRGATMASIINPLAGTQSSVVGLLLTQVLSALFLLMGGFNVLLAALYDSYRLMPVGTALTWQHSVLTLLQQDWNLLFELGLRCAMPAIVIMLLIDLALGLINRTAQQLDVFFLAMPLKSLAAFFMLLVSLDYLFGSSLARFNDVGHVWQHLLKALS